MPYPDSEYPSILRGRGKRESQRLMAAAPEMLAALRDAVYFIKAHNECLAPATHGSNQDWIDYCVSIHKSCADVIAKAEGEGVMSKWHVNVVRVGYASRIIEVAAESEEEAKQLAMDTAGNYQFSEHTSDYEFDWIAPAKAEGRE